MGYHVYFRLQATNCRDSMTKHREQSTEDRAKRIDSIWSQVCFSLLQQVLENEHIKREKGFWCYCINVKVIAINSTIFWLPIQTQFRDYSLN